MINEKDLFDKINNILVSSIIDNKIKEVIKELCTFSGWPYGEAWKLDNEKKVMIFHTAWFINADFESYKKFSSICKFSPGVGLIGKTWSDGVSVLMEDLSAHYNFIRGDVAEKSGFIEGFAVPVKEGDKVTGIIDFFITRKQHGDEQTRNIIADIIDKISIKF
jgi:two-component system, sensor histidine kinase and response regulator